MPAAPQIKVYGAEGRGRGAFMLHCLVLQTICMHTDGVHGQLTLSLTTPLCRGGCTLYDHSDPRSARVGSNRPLRFVHAL